MLQITSASHRVSPFIRLQHPSNIPLTSLQHALYYEDSYTSLKPHELHLPFGAHGAVGSIAGAGH